MFIVSPLSSVVLRHLHYHSFGAILNVVILSPLNLSHSCDCGGSSSLTDHLVRGGPVLLRWSIHRVGRMASWSSCISAAWLLCDCFSSIDFLLGTTVDSELRPALWSRFDCLFSAFTPVLLHRFALVSPHFSPPHSTPLRLRLSGSIISSMASPTLSSLTRLFGCLVAFLARVSRRAHVLCPFGDFVVIEISSLSFQG